MTPERLAEAIKRRLWMASPTLRRRATAAEVRDIAAGLVDLFTAQAAEVDRLRAQVAAVELALGDAWDDGNATGLDGWVGPGRGTEPDEYAIRTRERYIEKKMGALASGDEVQRCSGLSATWCPVHGNCTCPRLPVDFDFDSLDHPSCPLHAPTSEHPIGVEVQP